MVDMKALSKQNKGYKYILMIIDVFSKYGWAIPLNSKTGIEVKAEYKRFLKKEYVNHCG